MTAASNWLEGSASFCAFPVPVEAFRPCQSFSAVPFAISLSSPASVGASA